MTYSERKFITPLDRASLHYPKFRPSWQATIGRTMLDNGAQWKVGRPPHQSVPVSTRSSSLCLVLRTYIPIMECHPETRRPFNGGWACIKVGAGMLGSVRFSSSSHQRPLQRPRLQHATSSLWSPLTRLSSIHCRILRLSNTQMSAVDTTAAASAVGSQDFVASRSRGRSVSFVPAGEVVHSPRRLGPDEKRRAKAW